MILTFIFVVNVDMFGYDSKLKLKELSFPVSPTMTWIEDIPAEVEAGYLYVDGEFKNSYTLNGGPIWSVNFPLHIGFRPGLHKIVI